MHYIEKKEVIENQENAWIHAECFILEGIFREQITRYQRISFLSLIKKLTSNKQMRNSEIAVVFQTMEICMVDTSEIRILLFIAVLQS